MTPEQCCAAVQERLDATADWQKKTPLEKALWHAEPWRLQQEVTDWYNKFVAEGDAPDVAASRALMEWDI